MKSFFTLLLLVVYFELQSSKRIASVVNKLFITSVVSDDSYDTQHDGNDQVLVEIAVDVKWLGDWRMLRKIFTFIGDKIKRIDHDYNDEATYRERAIHFAAELVKSMKENLSQTNPLPLSIFKGSMNQAISFTNRRQCILLVYCEDETSIKQLKHHANIDATHVVKLIESKKDCIQMRKILLDVELCNLINENCIFMPVEASHHYSKVFINHLDRVRNMRSIDTSTRYPFIAAFAVEKVDPKTKVSANDSYEDSAFKGYQLTLLEVLERKTKEDDDTFSKESVMKFIRRVVNDGHSAVKRNLFLISKK